MATMPFIILCVYIITEFLKRNVLKNKTDSLPPIAAIIGGLIGLILYRWNADYISSTNCIEAATTGMASGLAAVGCNQVYKRFLKFTSTTDDDSSDTTNNS